MINDAQNLSVFSNFTTICPSFEHVVNKIKTEIPQEVSQKGISDNYIANNNNIKINRLIQQNSTIQTGSNIVSVASGSIDSMSSMFERIRDLSIQSSSGLYDEKAVQEMQTEVDDLKSNISQIIDNTGFAGISPFKEDSFDIQTGMKDGQKVFETLELKIDLSDKNFDITTQEGVKRTNEDINFCLNTMDISKNDVQNVMKQLQSSIATNNVAIANISSTTSSILDADIANANSEVIKNTILVNSQNSLDIQVNALNPEILMGLTKGA